MKYPAAVPHGIMFHHFHGTSHHRGQGSISAGEFERILRFLGPARILGPEEWIRRSSGGTLAPEDLCITFDDGLLCQYDVALPVLDKLGIKAFWFVYSAVFEKVTVKLEIYRKFRSTRFEGVQQFYEAFFAKVAQSALAGKAEQVGNYDIARFRADNPLYSSGDARYQILRDRVLSRSEFEALVDAMIVEAGTSLEELSVGLWMNDTHLAALSGHGHEVGLHSYSHPTVLGDLPAAEQEREYRRNHAHIAGACGRPPRTMSHPSNSYDDETLRILHELDILCGFRANMVARFLGQPLNAGPYELAREDHMDIMNILPKTRKESDTP